MTAEGGAGDTAAGGRFAGRVALVTGAGRGIGAVIAQVLAAEGASVTVTDVRGAADTAHAITDAGGRAAAVDLDLTDRKARDGLVDAVLGRWGRLDVLVNNAAAHGSRVPLAELDYAAWDAVLEANLAATAFLSTQAAAAMTGGGSIVNVASIQQRLPLPHYGAYIASKGGITALSNALAVELAPDVRVNLVAPGVIDTESFRTTPGADALSDGAGSDGAGTGAQAQPATLLGRAGTAHEIARAVAFLASDESSFTTGATLTVDGGRTLSRKPDPLAGG